LKHFDVAQAQAEEKRVMNATFVVGIAPMVVGVAVLAFPALSTKN
jgi:uncharacterized membrane protein HdeD (DUF308 family)